jgi:hypothetical protein
VTFSDAEKRECAEREAKMRRRVYPRWVEQKKMSLAQADKQIALMDEIADDYRKKELVLL